MALIDMLAALRRAIIKSRFQAYTDELGKPQNPLLDELTGLFEAV